MTTAEGVRRPTAGIGVGATPGKIENPQPGIVSRREVIFKADLPIYQVVAAGLTQAGFGSFSYEVAEEQTHPYTGESLAEYSELMAVTYTGSENTDSLFKVVQDAKGIKNRLQSQGRSKEEVWDDVEHSIPVLIELELIEKEIAEKFVLANTLSEIAYKNEVAAMQHEGQRSKNLSEQASKSRAEVRRLHAEISNLIQRKRTVKIELSKY